MELKCHIEFKNLPIEDKKIIGENYGFFHKQLSCIETY